MPRWAKCLCSSQHSEQITSLEQGAKILDKIQTSWISRARFYHILHVTRSKLSLRLAPAAIVNLDLYTYNCVDLQMLLLSFQILEVKLNHELKSMNKRWTALPTAEMLVYVFQGNSRHLINAWFSIYHSIPCFLNREQTSTTQRQRGKSPCIL